MDPPLIYGADSAGRMGAVPGRQPERCAGLSERDGGARRDGLAEFPAGNGQTVHFLHCHRNNSLDSNKHKDPGTDEKPKRMAMAGRRIHIPLFPAGDMLYGGKRVQPVPVLQVLRNQFLITQR